MSARSKSPFWVRFGPVGGMRLNVGCFERRQAAFAGDRAAAVVGISDERAECALSEAGPSEIGFAESRLFHGVGESVRREPLFDRVPQRVAGRGIGAVGETPLDVARPIGRNRDPVVLVQEERLGENVAPDRGAGRLRGFAIVRGARDEFGQARGAVLLAERIPGEKAGQDGEPNEEPTADDVVPW